ncbi:uncharacterized protein LOC115763158 [Drosophila novamexicana]|uniref:uncharacterized protein LOC115763158 n=1 Tax=Drosophila novamexicana TaxID=47314 RepID=UPI0011E5D452|nr:uncharacterized protein LOC115763158 [Drosophila novamexicana]
MNVGLLEILLTICFGRTVQAALVWNTGGTVGLFTAIAIPLDLPSRHVFMSYYFEATYTLPKTWHEEPPVFRRGNDTDTDPSGDPVADFGDYYDDYEDHKPSKLKPPKRKHKTKKKTKPTPTPSSDDYKDFFEGYPRQERNEAVARHRQEHQLLSRTKFYKILGERFEEHGLGSGDGCLLRLICEANSAQLGELNGVLGSLMHVMFSPSSSQYEALPQRYYNAERNGQRDNCQGYSAKCGRSVLDLIARPLIDYIVGNKSSSL